MFTKKQITHRDTFLSSLKMLGFKEDKNIFANILSNEITLTKQLSNDVVLKITSKPGKDTYYAIIINFRQEMKPIPSILTKDSISDIIGLLENVEKNPTLYVP